MRAWSKDEQTNSVRKLSSNYSRISREEGVKIFSQLMATHQNHNIQLYEISLIWNGNDCIKVRKAQQFFSINGDTSNHNIQLYEISLIWNGNDCIKVRKANQFFSINGDTSKP